MSLVDAIAAVRASGLTVPEKRRAIYDLKGQAIVNAISDRVGQVITRGVYTLTMTENPQYDSPRLIFPGLVLTKNGVPVPLDLPLYIVNPPVMVPDGAGGWTLNLLQAIRDAIMDMAR